MTPYRKIPVHKCKRKEGNRKSSLDHHNIGRNSGREYQPVYALISEQNFMEQMGMR